MNRCWAASCFPAWARRPPGSLCGLSSRRTPFPEAPLRLPFPSSPQLGSPECGEGPGPAGGAGLPGERRAPLGHGVLLQRRPQEGKAPSPLPPQGGRAAGSAWAARLLLGCYQQKPRRDPRPHSEATGAPFPHEDIRRGSHQFARDERVPNSSSSVLSTASKSR